MENHLQLMLDSAPIPCFLIRPDATAIDCNKAAVSFFGFASKDEALRRYREIFPKEERQEVGYLTKHAAISEVMKNGQANFDYTHLDASGEEIECRVNLLRLELDGETAITVYLQDLRDFKSLSAKLIRLGNVEEESRAKSQFLARMSHEIRTPVSVINGIAHIQLQRGGHSPQVEEAFLQIQNSTELLTSIINDILDLSKVSAGKVELREKVYSSASLIMDSIQLFLMQLGGNKNIRFMVDIDEKLPAYFIGDILRVKQVINNLLSNAVDHTEEGYISLAFNYEDKQLSFSVSDTGRGVIDEEAGLGISISRQLVKLMKGEILEDSESDKGSWFHVRIPQIVEGDEHLSQETIENIKKLEFDDLSTRKNEDFTYEPMNYGRVLVVDDQESNLFVAKGLLLPYGLSVDLASSGFEALEIIQTGKLYDVIFMDHMMPDMDGIETARLMRDRGYALPIVALTANAILGQSELFLNNGFQGFISKPIDLLHLDMYLKRLIRDNYPDEIVESARRIMAANKDEKSGISGQIMEAFLRDMRQAIDFLSAFMERNWNDEMIKQYAISTHGAKSSLFNIGEPRLAEMAAALELAGYDGDVTTIRLKTPIFIEELKTLSTMLMRKIAAEDVPDENPAFLREQLTIIQWDCESLNKRAIKDSLNKLDRMKWSKNTKELLSKISAHILHSEFDEAAKLAQEAIKL